MAITFGALLGALHAKSDGRSDGELCMEQMKRTA